MKWYRIATAGQTVDGREIQDSWIVEMADSYDPAVYGARINVEHTRGWMPDGEFGSYGDVIALKAEQVAINGEQKMALFAQLKPNEKLRQLNAKNQKVYTSVEINTNFAKTGKAYLVGLAVTDSPASLGTEMLQFRALATNNVYSEAVELEFDFSEDLAEKIVSKIKEWFKVEQGDDANPAQSDTDQPEQGEEGKQAYTTDDLDVVADALGRTVFGLYESKFKELEDTNKDSQAKIQELEDQIKHLSAIIDTTPTTPNRPTATGQDTASLVDC